MTLLAPADAIVAAAVGGLLLVLLYILRLRRRPLRVSSILHWPKAVVDAQANEPFQRLRPSWLMALQAAALALLSLAAGRPVLDDGGGGAAARTVIIIDASASMNAIDAPGRPTRLEDAKRQATALAARLTGEGRAVAVVAAGAEPTIKGNLSTSASLAEAAIAAVQGTDQPADMQAAIVLAQGLVSSDDETGVTGARVALFTDSVGQRPEQGWRSSLPVSIERIGPAPGMPAPFNRGIVGLNVRRDLRDPSLIRVFVQVTSNRMTDGGRDADAIPLRTLVSGREVDRRVLNLSLTDASGGRGGATIELPAVGSGLLQLEITDPDALAADNAVQWVLDSPMRPSLLVVRPADEAPPAAAALLDDVVSELGLRAVERVSWNDYERLASTRALGVFDCVLFDRVTPLKACPLPSISFGATMPGSGLERSDGTSAAGGQTLFWQRSHPLLASVSLDALVIDDPAVLTRTSDQTSIDELINARGGLLLATANDQGLRRIVAAFDLGRSNWLLQPSFPVFMAESIRFLLQRHGGSPGRAWLTTQPVLIQAGAGELSVTGPVNVRFDAVQAAGEGERSVGIMPRVGVYKAQGEGVIESAVAVNLLDAAESMLAPADLPMTTPRAKPPSPGDERLGTPVWRYLLAAAFGLLLVEWFVGVRALRA
ncbi:MAG: VWA domain-containing protein [Phycisphaerae bacterium]